MWTKADEEKLELLKKILARSKVPDLTGLEILFVAEAMKWLNSFPERFKVEIKEEKTKVVENASKRRSKS